jgi:glucuronate isomerase
MLTEMAGMSLEDGMVMQIHPGSYRNHNTELYERFGPDKGADIPLQINYTEALQPLLAKHGNNPDLNIILFTLDESNYARELATLAGHYPCLTLGPPWWFHDAPQGMMRFRDQVTETAGFYNTAGLVCEHKISMDEARQLSIDLTYNLARKAYKLPLEAKAV